MLLRVEVWRDTDFDAAASAVESVVKDIIQRAPDFGWMTVKIRAKEINTLTHLDAVSWVEPESPPPAEFNDQVRKQLQFDRVQVFPYGLTGQGIKVGVWNSGAVGMHEDFQGRGTVVESVLTSEHATHVAGTLAGFGVRSEAIGGKRNQWRGMATQVQFFSWDFHGNVSDEHRDGIQERGIHLSNNSWGYLISRTLDDCDIYGNYDGMARDFDNIVHGDIGGRAIPIIFAVGDERDDGDCNVTGASATTEQSCRLPLPRTLYLSVQ